MFKTRNSLIIGILLIFAMILAGCSADALMQTSEKMENMGKAGMGKAGEAVVDEAVTETEGFVAKNESYMNFYNPPYDPETGKANIVTFKTMKDDGCDGEQALRDLCASFVTRIGKATETSASDKAILEALAQPYPETGITYPGPVFRRFGDALDGSTTGGGILGMMTMLAYTYEFLDPSLVDSITGYNVPIPIRAYDTLPILNKAMSVASYILELVQYNKEHPQPAPEPEPSGTSFDYTSLLAIPESIAAHTGDRNYQTVGDKISVALIYDILDAVNSVFAEYKKTHLEDPTNEYSAVDYSEFGFKWIMKNCAGYIDRVVADVNAIGYINGTHIDAAGIIGSYVSGL